MSFVIDVHTDETNYDYFLTGNYSNSISHNRYSHLQKLWDINEKSLLISLRDPTSNKWLVWTDLHSSTMDTGLSLQAIQLGRDLHRSICYNEVVVESDEPEYIENVRRARLIGRILEDKGFVPHYFYSGGKSIHVHIWFDFVSLLQINEYLQDQVLEKFKYKSMFVKKFMLWLRDKIISCWGLNLGDFDKQLVNASHLIRCCGSMNGYGCKTFLGKHYRDIPNFPTICNYNTQKRPEWPCIELSRPNASVLIEEFLQYTNKNTCTKKNTRNYQLTSWMDNAEKLRPCVQHILSNDFEKHGDGRKRGMFILMNELKRLHGPDIALQKVQNWNLSNNFRIPNFELIYRASTPEYKLSCNYIHEFLEGIGAGKHTRHS